MRLVSCQFMFTLTLLFLSSFAFGYELILVRHFEKISDIDNPGLTRQGQIRAKNLAKLLGQADITRVYSTNYNRTKQTALPIALQKGFAIRYYDPRNLSSFAADLLARQESTLIVGHSNTTPTLIKLLGGEAKDIEEKDYGEVFFIRIDSGKVTQSSHIIPIQE